MFLLGFKPSSWMQAEEESATMIFSSPAHLQLHRLVEPRPNLPVAAVDFLVHLVSAAVTRIPLTDPHVPLVLLPPDLPHGNPREHRSSTRANLLRVCKDLDVSSQHVCHDLHQQAAPRPPPDSSHAALARQLQGVAETLVGEADSLQDSAAEVSCGRAGRDPDEASSCVFVGEGRSFACQPWAVDHSI
eukprot:441983-Hanusia_phi.AAC.3